MNFINQSNNVSASSSMIWTPFTAPAIWSPYPMQDSDTDRSASPFSTPATSPYGSPPTNSFAQYYHVPKLPEPIARPRPTASRQKNQVHNTREHITKRLPRRSEQVDMSEFIRKSRSHMSSNSRKMVCTFCKSNGESEEIYSSHSLKSSVNKITCPILMKYTCVECGASGENTHTIKYCPVMQKKLRQQMLSKLMVVKD